MAYTANVPLNNQAVNQTQAPILANFQALAPWGNGYGIYTNQLTAPSVTGNDIGLYNLTSSLTSLPALFVQLTSGTAKEITSTQTVTSGSPAFTESWCQLPSGVIIKWGYRTGTFLSAGANIFTFNASFPAFTTAPLVLLTPATNTSGIDPNTVYYVYNRAPTAFNVWAAPRTTGAATYYSPLWIAIGV